jgi:hypothetical protein
MTIVARVTRRTVLLLLACVFLLARHALTAGEAEMRPSKPEVRRDVIAAIAGQLAAFRAGDVAAAYGYAARPLREQKSLQVFEGIVRFSYPEIWANTRAEYGVVRDDGQRATLLVHVFAKESDASYDFTLLRESAGWRVYGVVRHVPKKEERV